MTNLEYYHFTSQFLKKKNTKDIRRTLLPHNSDHKYGITKDTVHLSHVSNGTQGFQR